MGVEELKKLTVKELKTACKDLGLKNYSNKSEDELIEMLQDAVTDETEEVEEVEEVEETETTEEVEEKDQTEQEEQKTIVLKKLIKGAFGFAGKTYKGSTFELTKEEFENPKIQHAIKNKIIEVKK